MPVWREERPGVEELKVAVMGCVVNGPGESKHANIGISLPGTGETPAAPVFIDGRKALTLRGPNIAADFEALRPHGFSDEDIMDIIQTAAFFNYSNRVASALEMRPNRQFYNMGRPAS